MPAMEARRTIRAAQTSGVQFTAAQAYDLTLRATGSVSEAESVFREVRRVELKHLDAGQA